MRRFAVLIVLAACGSSPKPTVAEPSPEDPHASEFRALAQAHAARAARLARIADGMGGPSSDSNDRATQLWLRSLDEEHAANDQLASATRLDQNAAEACVGMTKDQMETSPLDRDGVAWVREPNGIVVLLPTSSGPPDALMAQLRCHRAWMRLDASHDQQCPLDLPHVDVVAYGDQTGISVDLTSNDRIVVPELQRRTEYAVSHASGRAGSASP